MGATRVEHDLRPARGVVASELNQFGAVHRGQAHIEQDQRRRLLPQGADEPKSALQRYYAKTGRLQRFFDGFPRNFAVVDDQDQGGTGSLISHYFVLKSEWVRSVGSALRAPARALLFALQRPPRFRLNARLLVCDLDLRTVAPGRSGDFELLFAVATAKSTMVVPAAPEPMTPC